MQTAHIETGRLTLRTLRRSDANRIAKLANDAAIARMLGRMPHPYDLDQARAFIDRCDQKDPGLERIYAIAQQDELIGVLGFHAVGEIRRRTEVGYWLGRDYWGRGYATEALRGALVWASADWGRRMVLSSHFADNQASAGVLIKAGFLYTGEVDARECLARGETTPTRMMVWLA